jgi:hypothetical protein
MIIHFSVEMGMLITNHHLGTGFFVQKGTIFICDLFSDTVSGSDYRTSGQYQWLQGKSLLVTNVKCNTKRLLA